MYRFLSSLLFTLPPETAHHLALAGLKLVVREPVAAALTRQVTSQPVTVMGLDFPNAVGLAAGLDKNADYLDALAGLGFGFIEVGTVTPRPQPGNPKPRLFRIPGQQALINRMGFNNKGIDHLVRRVSRTRYRGVLGINIGKNKDTPNDKAVDDYLLCLRRAYPHAGYVTINVSSPNTPGLRELQKVSELSRLLSTLLEAREQLSAQHGRRVPLLLKIAPDLDEPAMDDIAECLLNQRVDGLIVGNTTLSRPGLEHSPVAREAGGLSGKPLMPLATQVLRSMQARLKGEIPLIGVGGILSAKDAAEKFNAGASLVQIYSGFVYRGPALIREIAGLQKNLTTEGTEITERKQ
ncbi:MAG TPA: quinone-dependent dihydroorotate dehydrogenase [Gammaproteobacteria bacterium]|jgi:dihydroorotate dehydrogenase